MVNFFSFFNLLLAIAETKSFNYTIFKLISLECSVLPDSSNFAN